MKLDTGDASEDLIILADDSVHNGIPAQHVIAAWGDSPVFNYHGPNCARSTIQWLPFSGTGWTSKASVTDKITLFQDIMKTQANESFPLINSNYSVQPASVIHIVQSDRQFAKSDQKLTKKVNMLICLQTNQILFFFRNLVIYWRTLEGC